MKQIGGLFDALVARANLDAAAQRAAAGKRSHPDVRAFFANLDEELTLMQDELSRGVWSFSPYTVFAVRDTKTRTIHAPAFRDRVVHHAIIGATGPVFEMGALAHSYACRRGRGQHAALATARQWTRRGLWYGKMDVRKFYDSVDHAVLRRQLSRRFREQRLLHLFDSLIASYQTSPGKGIPIGALTSQYFGNFYLDVLDRRIKDTGLAPRYLRYMDDALVFGSPEMIERVRTVAVDALASLSLELKHGGEWNRCVQGVPFLGFVLYPERTRLNRLGRRRLRRKLRGLERDYADGHVGDLELQARAASLFAHAQTADDGAWRRTVLALGRIDADGEVLERQPRDSRRLLEQHGQELPLREPQQEGAREPEQEPGLPRLFVPRHDGFGQTPAPPDDALSRSGASGHPDETSGKTPATVEIPCGQTPKRTTEKAAAGAPGCPS